ncbi:MAG: EAL domain-containing protein [Candidatus Korobacteraceae bacterium]|jgi:EAL domain-containing protein (putative c-di-GMP-specific phosphodiesterase class I)
MLDKMLEPGGITTVMQPIVRVSRGLCEVASVECLTRGPAGSPFESPSVLFEYARRKHAENLLDRHAIATGLLAAKSMPAPMRISVNAYASTVGGDPGFVDFLSETAQICGIELPRLTVEVVEHSPAWNISGFLSALRQLRMFGIQVALDDVGTGHSNYRMMLDAEPNCFKIDAYLVRKAYADRKRRSVLASIVALAHDLGSSVVAEGVEEVQELEVLLDLGVDLIQGYLFSRPLPINELIPAVTRINRLGYIQTAKVPRRMKTLFGTDELPAQDHAMIIVPRPRHTRFPIRTAFSLSPRP